MPRPLEGMRIIEIGHQLAGPFCGMVLGDLGADVIKIERPKAGDHVRVFKPQINGESACFAALNRNKRSIVIDLKEPEGREIVLKLIAESDALFENNRPGALAKLGLGPDDGLPSPCVLKPEWIRIVDRTYLGPVLAHLPEQHWPAIQSALLDVLGFDGSA